MIDSKLKEITENYNPIFLFSTMKYKPIFPRGTTENYTKL